MLIERRKPCDCGGAISLPKGSSAASKFYAQTELRHEATKVDDVGPNRECGDELRSLQRLSLVRQSRGGG